MVGLVVNKGVPMVRMSSFFISTMPATMAVTIVLLLPSITGMGQLLHCDPGHSPIQHSSAKLDGDPWIIGRGELQDEHWNAFIALFYWRYSNSRPLYSPRYGMVNLCVPSKCSICFTGCISYLCSSQKSWVMVETCAPVSMRAVTQMSPTKISASFTLPIKSTVASSFSILGTSDIFHWLGVGMSAGAGSAFCLGAGERFCCRFSLLEFKGHVHFGCWSTCDTCAPIPGSYSIEFGLNHFPPWPDFDCFWLHC